MSPRDQAALVNAIVGDLASIDAVAVFNEAKAQAEALQASPGATAPTSSTTPIAAQGQHSTSVNRALLAAAVREIKAGTAKNRAESSYRAARWQLVAVAIDLYTDRVAPPLFTATSGNDAWETRAELVSVVVNRASSAAGQPKKPGQGKPRLLASQSRRRPGRRDRGCGCETDYLNFPAGGQVAGSDNNFAGIGACDSCASEWNFPSAQTGVAAQLQLLHEYASSQPVPGPLPSAIGPSGCCTTWMALSGVWATGPDYGYHILLIYKQMLEWVLGQTSHAAGL